VVCINKMDLVGYEKDVFEQVKSDFEEFSARLETKDVQFVPISALKGDNVVNRSENMPWFEGTTLLYYLENVHIASDHNLIDCRFPVQYVVRPHSDDYHDYRGYAGRVAGGVFKKGDEVMLLPSGFTTKIKSINTFEGELEEAHPPMSVTICVEDDLDLSRGDMIVRPNNSPNVEQTVDLMICWFNEKPLRLNGKYTLMHTNNEVRCIVKEVRYKMDVNTLKRDLEFEQIEMNDIARVQLRTTKPLFFDSYSRNRITGSVILVDEGTHETVAAGMII
jgi:sulfate adenylyltransferase subunit 1